MPGAARAREVARVSAWHPGAGAFVRVGGGRVERGGARVHGVRVLVHVQAGIVGDEAQPHKVARAVVGREAVAGGVVGSEGAIRGLVPVGRIGGRGWRGVVRVGEHLHAPARWRDEGSERARIGGDGAARVGGVEVGGQPVEIEADDSRRRGEGAGLPPRERAAEGHAG